MRKSGRKEICGLVGEKRKGTADSEDSDRQ